MDYYKVERLSASLINRFYSDTFLTGFVPGPTAATLDGGNAFHLMTYQPDISNSYINCISLKEIAMFSRMATVARKTPVISAFIKNKNTEYEKEYFFDIAGMPFKAKLDAVLPLYWHDLKSTACKTESSFKEAFFNFGYDRQAAIYMTATGKYGYFTGVSKTEPHSTFLIDTSKYKKDIKKALEAVIELGQMYLKLNKGNIYVG